MPVSRLLVRPDADPQPLDASDRIGLSLVVGESSLPPVGASSEIGLGSAGSSAAGSTLAGPTATPPGQPVAAPAPIATVIGPLGPVRAARWNVQLPLSAGVSSPAGVDGASSPNADATNS